MDKKGKFNFVSMEELDKITIDLSNDEANALSDTPKKRGRKKKSTDDLSTTKKTNSTSRSLKEESVVSLENDKEVVDDNNEKDSLKDLENNIELDSIENKEEDSNIIEDKNSDEVIIGDENDNEDKEEVSSERETEIKEDVSFDEDLKDDNEDNYFEDDARDDIREDNKSISNNGSNEEELPKKFYFSFEARVISMVVGCVVLFITSCIYMNKAMDFVVLEKVSYSEKSASQYSVCLKENDLYPDSCLSENIDYNSSIVDKVHSTFRYEANFSSDVLYKGNYSIVALTRVVDNNQPDKVLYEKEDYLVKEKNISSNSSVVSLEDTVSIDYNKYLSSVSNYQQGAKSTLEIALYIDDLKESRKVSSLKMNLSNTNFKIGKINTKNDKRTIDTYKNEWSSKCMIFAVLSVISSIITLVLLYKITRLVLRVTMNRNKYQKYLDDILREYDRLIVIARNGYISTEEKEVVKVKDFDELLDIRDNLEKPIIYSRINDVKSEFILEDDSKIYKFILKEADL